MLRKLFSTRTKTMRPTCTERAPTNAGRKLHASTDHLNSDREDSLLFHFTHFHLSDEYVDALVLNALSVGVR